MSSINGNVPLDQPEKEEASRLFAFLQALLPKVAALLACGMVALGAFFFSVGGLPVANRALSMSLTGGALLVAALLLAPPRKAHVGRPASCDVTRLPQTRTDWWMAGAGVILLALLAEINGNIFDLSFLRHTPDYVQFAVLVVGVALLVFGAAGMRPRRLARLAYEWRSRELLALAGILLVALIARAWRLESLMPFFVDEIHFANPVTHFYMADDIELLLPFSSVAAFPYLFPYMQWWFVEIIGRNLAGLRALSVGLGVVNVLTLYLLARELFDRKTALIAAAALAVFPPHIQFSRLALNNIADPVFGTLALYFIARGLRRDMRYNFALAGAMLGLTQYFYEGGRLLYPVLALGWLAILGIIGYAQISAQLALAWRRGTEARKTALRHIEAINGEALAKAALVMLLVMILVAAPIYYTLVGQGRGVFQRMDTAGLSESTASDLTGLPETLEHFKNRFYETFLVHVAVEDAQLYYGGETSYLLGYVTPFFLLGMFYALWLALSGESRRGALLVLLWIGLTWVGNTLLQESRISARYVVAFPALALAIALGVRCVLLLFWAERPRARNRLALGIVTALATLQLAYYFGPHVQTYAVQFRDQLGRDSHDAMFRSIDFPPDTYVHLVDVDPISDRVASDMIRYLAPHLFADTLEPDEVTSEWLRTLVVNRDHAFFLPANDAVTVAKLRSRFQQVEGPFFSEQDIPEEKQYALYYAPRRFDIPDYEPPAE